MVIALHFDFRLEHDGVFKSWVVPKGLPEDIGIRRLAIRTDDHILEFGDFQGVIPEGNYGAGKIEVWDSGTYEPIVWTEDEISIRIHGKRLTGLYQLIRCMRAGMNSWLCFKRRDRSNDNQ